MYLDVVPTPTARMKSNVVGNSAETRAPRGFHHVGLTQSVAQLNTELCAFALTDTRVNLVRGANRTNVNETRTVRVTRPVDLTERAGIPALSRQLVAPMRSAVLSTVLNNAPAHLDLLEIQK